jgi:hypothetical protein
MPHGCGGPAVTCAAERGGRGAAGRRLLSSDNAVCVCVCVCARARVRRLLTSEDASTTADQRLLLQVRLSSGDVYP